MKKLLLLLLTLLLLPTTAWAADPPVQERYTISPWAVEAVASAERLGLMHYPDSGDLREPINRSLFGESASALVVLAFEREFNVCDGVFAFRAAQDDPHRSRPMAQTLGILQGHGNGNLALGDPITRQEAAVMLARAYRLYAGEGPALTEPLTYTDADQIASWAREDVRLMTQLGILNGVGEGRFQPTGLYTAEQCFATLVRLYEKTWQDRQPGQTDPFAMTAREAAIGDFWNRGYHLLDYVEAEPLTAFAYLSGGGTMAGQKCFVAVLDQDLQVTAYPTVILSESNAYYGDSAATVEDVSVSEDRTKVVYHATLERDVYPTDAQGNPGPLLFAKGRYTVTIDLATGDQSYTREALKT